MRLSKHEQAVILTNVHKYIAADAQVWLFGSRCDDSKAGGDIINNSRRTASQIGKA